MIVITGALGFIGSCLISHFGKTNDREIIAVDDFSKKEKYKNLEGKKILQRIERNSFEAWLNNNAQSISCILHLGARTDTAEFDTLLLDQLNLNYSKMIWKNCTKYNIPLLYASSAATYGLGEFGFTDDHDIVSRLKPLNPYGESKNNFDLWVLEQQQQPPFWAGLKFFNVYGPNEYHKGRMASVIFHFFNQISKSNAVKLFRSHRANYADGEQKRDFIYVKDLIDVVDYIYHHLSIIESGLYNIGTGTARTFNDLALALFRELNIPSRISYIDTPIDIREKYQYFTEANMNKLTRIGYSKPFTVLEEGIADYVHNYLKVSKYY